MNKLAFDAWWSAQTLKGDPARNHNLVRKAFEAGRESAAAPELLAILRRYVSAYPAFRMKPIGAPDSPARIEQENLMALEESALAALARAI